MKKKKLTLEDQIRIILNSVSDTSRKEYLKNTLIKNPHKIKMYMNLLLAAEGNLENALDNIKLLSSGRVSQQEKMVQCDNCGQHLVEYYVVQLLEEKDPLIYGGTCMRNLQDDLNKMKIPTLNAYLEEEQKKIIEKRDKEADMFSLSLDQLEEIKKKIIEDINQLKLKRESIEKSILEIEKKKTRTVPTTEINRKKYLLEYYNKQIEIRNIVLEEIEKDNLDMQIKAWSIDKSIAMWLKDTTGSILTSLESYNLTKKEKMIFDEFKYNFGEIPKYMYGALKNIWARRSLEPKEALLGTYEIDLRILNHLTKLIQNNYEKSEYCKKEINGIKAFFEEHKYDDPELINVEFFKTRVKEIEALKYIWQTPIERLKKMHELVGDVDISRVDDLLNTKEFITRVDVMKIFGELPERENTRKIINDEFVRKSGLNIDEFLVKWLNVYEQEKKLVMNLMKRLKIEKESELQDEKERSLSKNDYSLLKRIAKMLEITKGKSIYEITLGFGIIEFEEIIGKLITLQKKDEIGQRKNINLVSEDIFIEYLNNKVMAKRLEKITTESKKIKENFKEFCENIILYCDDLLNNFVTVNYKEIKDRILYSHTDFYDSALYALQKELKNEELEKKGLVNKLNIEKIIKYYGMIKNLQEFPRAKINLIKRVLEYSAYGPWFDENIKYYSSKKIAELEQIYEEALYIENSLNENAKEAAILYKNLGVIIENITPQKIEIKKISDSIKKIIKNRFTIYDPDEIILWLNNLKKEYVPVEQELRKKLEAIVEENKFSAYFETKYADAALLRRSIRDSKLTIWIKKTNREDLKRVIEEIENFSPSNEEIEKIHKNYLAWREEEEIRNFVVFSKKYGKKTIEQIANYGEDGIEELKKIAFWTKYRFVKEKIETYLKKFKK